MKRKLVAFIGSMKVLCLVSENESVHHQGGLGHLLQPLDGSASKEVIKKIQGTKPFI